MFFALTTLGRYLGWRKSLAIGLRVLMVVSYITPKDSITTSKPIVKAAKAMPLATPSTKIIRFSRRESLDIRIMLHSQEHRQPLR